MPAFELAALVANLKIAIDIVKGIRDLNSNVELKEQASKLLDIILSTQTSALSIQNQHSLDLEEIDKLKKQILQFENWEKTKLDYEFKQIAPGIFVYEYKSAGNDCKKLHWICPKCYEEHKKSILQYDFSSKGAVHFYNCLVCHNKLGIPFELLQFKSPDEFMK